MGSVEGGRSGDPERTADCPRGLIRVEAATELVELEEEGAEVVRRRSKRHDLDRGDSALGLSSVPNGSVAASDGRSEPATGSD